jgi:hypothetical protein
MFDQIETSESLWTARPKLITMFLFPAEGGYKIFHGILTSIS